MASKFDAPLHYMFIQISYRYRFIPSILFRRGANLTRVVPTWHKSYTCYADVCILIAKVHKWSKRLSATESADLFRQKNRYTGKLHNIYISFSILKYLYINDFHTSLGINIWKIYEKKHVHICIILDIRNDVHTCVFYSHLRYSIFTRILPFSLSILVIWLCNFLIFLTHWRYASTHRW